MLFFNIYNIFKFSIKGTILPVFEKFFNRELEYFKSKEIPVDLEIQLVPKIADPDITFFPNYGRDKEYFYTRDPFSRKVGIFSNSKVIAESKIDSGWLLKDIIEPLMLLHILPKGYSFLHASAVTKNNKSLIFTAFSGTGKTNLLVSLLKDGYFFLADELPLISKEGVVYPYPKPLSICSHNIKVNPWLTEVISNKNFIKKQKIRLLFPFYKIQNLYGLKYPKSLISRTIQIGLRKIAFRNFSVTPKDIGAKIGAPSKIDKVFLLFTNNNLIEPEIEEIKNKKLFATQLWANILGEKNNFFIKTALAYSFGFPEKKNIIGDENLKLGEEVIYGALKDVRCFQLMIPEKEYFIERSVNIIKE